MSPADCIQVHNACEHNLKSVSIGIPRNKLVVVTGVSGSGKSSLVFDVIYRESESRYLGSFSSYARQFLGRMKRPDVEKVEGLPAAISVDQRSIARNPRSTVGTITEIYDYLRLMFARLGRSGKAAPELRIERSLFSFNSPAGACPACKGLGVEDRLDPDLLIADENKSLRQRCMAITAPNGYIIYSQVTMDVLDQVCRAEGFSADVRWKDLTPEQKQVILYGSDKIEIPYGKHPLESRMRWSGITAKPRETGFYKGIIPVMETILRHKRNKNILRFVRSTRCSACDGARLNAYALSVAIDGFNIAQLASLQVDELRRTLPNLHFGASESEIAAPIIDRITKRIDLLERLGLGYLSLDRESTTLSGGEAQRLRIATLAGTGLSGLLYIFDEPSVGLHPRDSLRLIEVLEELRDLGNSVIVVEHEEEFIRHADWMIDIGPGAGVNGGRVLHNIEAADMGSLSDADVRQSCTLAFYSGLEKLEIPSARREGGGVLSILGAAEHNLKSIDVTFRLQALNAVTGVSGAGKSTLTNDILGDFLLHRLHGAAKPPGKCKGIAGWEGIAKLIAIHDAPIGRTPRSNPATYTGLFDHVRDLFAALPESQARGWGRSRFSFNTRGGRCESCEGAGYQEIGMRFMGSVEVLCEACDGRRFNDETLTIKCRGKNIDDVLDMSVSEAKEFFRADERVQRYLVALDDLGLGYIKLGQRSSTLSGGEAQRIKLATELARPPAAHTLYILDEPTAGLHQADVRHLLLALNRLVEHGNTVILIEHHLGLIAAADWVLDLGPESGAAGGRLVVEGTPEDVARCAASHTGRALREYLDRQLLNWFSSRRPPGGRVPQNKTQTTGIIQFKGVTTNNLKHVDIAIPCGKVTVLTGVSGSGKSSLAFDTLFAEGQNRFMESFSSYARSRIGMRTGADFEEMSGLTPTLAVDQRTARTNPRSTVGTMTGIYDLYRLLFSRTATADDHSAPPSSSLFSFNHQAGACPACAGMGLVTTCDPEALITHPEKPIIAGAMDGTKTGRFYGDPFGQYVATLETVGSVHGFDYSTPWVGLPEEAKRLALHGGGDQIYDVSWSFKRGKSTGEHGFKTRWKGLLALVNREYERKHADHRGQSMLALMKQQACPACRGSRLKQEAMRFTIGGMSVAAVSGLPVAAALEFFMRVKDTQKMPAREAAALPLVKETVRRLEFVNDLGLGYLSIDRAGDSLSAGECQRIRLAGQLGSGLTGITYVLDEPTVGLHSTDIVKLVELMRELQRGGNTVIVVEHDRDVILSADHVVELGPGAGSNGGAVVAEGAPVQIIRNPASVTGRYLSTEPCRRIVDHRPLQPGLNLMGANANNLKDIDLNIPSGGLVAVTGLSGSGKSSLVFDVIYESWRKGRACGCRSIDGFERFQRVVAAGQTPQFSTPYGNPATFTGILDRIRDLFAATDDARTLRLNKKHFSYAGKEGRCEACEGLGKVRVSMDFLSDVYVTCEACNGKRYREQVLDCRYRGRNIADVLAMTVADAATFFETNKTLTAQLKALESVGLDYLQLGQPLDTLSGGESQRLTLAAELMKPVRGRALYLFDEPATGLHFKDIEFLLELFHRLGDQGHTLIVIEHDLQVILSADWIIDLGPGAGDHGGRVVACGTSAVILDSPDSLTGRYLRTRV